MGLHHPSCERIVLKEIMEVVLLLTSVLSCLVTNRDHDRVEDRRDQTSLASVTQDPSNLNGSQVPIHALFRGTRDLPTLLLHGPITVIRRVRVRGVLNCTQAAL